MRPSSGDAGRSGREPCTPDSKVSLWFLKENVTEYWEVWTNPDARVFCDGRGGLWRKAKVIVETN